MKAYEIWSEGYVCTGMSSGCHYHGDSEGNSFEEAVLNFAKKNKDFEYYLSKNKTSGEYLYWGCYLYDNKKDAQKSFG